MYGVVLAVPLEPIGRDGLPWAGAIPQVGDTVWFSSVGWNGGTSSNRRHETDGRLLERWPALMPMSDMHMGQRPDGTMYGIGDYGIAAQEKLDGGVMQGLDRIGSAMFRFGGPGWEAVHGCINEGTKVWFRVTQGINGRNTIAPCPWGWCVRILSHNLTGIERRLQ